MIKYAICVLIAIGTCLAVVNGIFSATATCYWGNSFTMYYGLPESAGACAASVQGGLCAGIEAKICCDKPSGYDGKQYCEERIETINVIAHSGCAIAGSYSACNGYYGLFRLCDKGPYYATIPGQQLKTYIPTGGYCITQ